MLGEVSSVGNGPLESSVNVNLWSDGVGKRLVLGMGIHVDLVVSHHVNDEMLDPDD